MEDNLEYLKTINNLSETVKELAIDKDLRTNKKINTYKLIIVGLIIGWLITSGFYAYSINYFIYKAYTYDYTNKNINTNTNLNGGK